MGEIVQALATLLIAVGIAIALFLIFRRVIWWYWGIDRIVAALESIEHQLGAGPLTFEQRAIRDGGIAMPPASSQQRP